MIVATAGHVDHGKTALVRALTGVDTDRLPEEKARGLTIDLGFAYQDSQGGERVGFVDVPGHERFVRNMIAGVGAIDYVLLVVAADDGVMPQTREHLAIVDLLGCQRGAVVITKIDRVAPARVEEVASAAQVLLAGTALRSDGIARVSSITGQGIAALRQMLDAAIAAAQSRPVRGRFRLAVDRAFLVRGSGLVVTGAVHAGRVRVGDRLLLSPSGMDVRVRGLHAQNAAAEDGHAGQRCAINIAGPGLDKETVHRGDWLVDPALHRPTDVLDVRLRALPDLPRPLRSRSPVHIHLAAADVTGRLGVIGGRDVPPGEAAYARLLLDRPVAAAHGDRFIIRDQSARDTLGGGQVLDAAPPAQRQPLARRLARLQALDTDRPPEALSGLLAAQPDGVETSWFQRLWNLTDEELQGEALRSVKHEALGDGTLLSPQQWAALREGVLAALGRWHERVPDSVGPNLRELRSALTRTVPLTLLEAAVGRLAGERHLLRRGTALHLPGHEPRLRSDDAMLWERVAPFMSGAGLRAPRVREIAAEFDLEVDAAEAFLGRLAVQGRLHRVARNRFFPPEAMLELARCAQALAAEAEDGLFDARSYRDRAGIGRNVTIEVLEYFDRAGLTRRVGDRRRLLRTPEEVFGDG